MVRILWADDEVDPEDPSVWLLTTAGYRVDCAQTAAAAIALAAARKYSVILLDLRLPDATGLTVLETVRGRGINTPVLLLTAFGDIPMSVAAMRLGAADVREKPLVGNDLLAAVRAVQGPAACAGPSASAVITDIPTIGAPLLKAVDGWARDESPSPERSRRLLTALVNAVCQPELDLEDFLMCAGAVRECAARLADPADAIAADLRARALSPKPSRMPPELREVGALLTRVDLSAARGRRLGDRVLDAAARPSMERLLRSRTRMGLGQWRSVLAMRHAVTLLCGHDTALKEVAWEVGFEHASQFDREFVRLLGLSPGEFRRVAGRLLASATGAVLGWIC